MKRTVIISLLPLILFAVSLHAQYVNPPQQKIYTYTDTTYTTKDSIFISASLPQFQINTYTLGWHWASGRSMTESLGFTQGHLNRDNIYNSVDSIAANINIIKNSEGIYSNGNHLKPMNTISMQWEPTLLINSDSLKYLQYRQYDKEKSVFGFRTVLGEPLVTNPVDSNYQCLLLKTTGNYVGENVLANPWSDSALYIFNTLSDTLPDDYPAYAYYGYDFVFSINLRRNDIRNNIQDNTPVLVIKLPYKTVSREGYILFSDIPTNIANDFEIITNLGIARGRKQKKIHITTDLDSIIITRNMLPINNNEVTINAYFKCREGSIFENPKLAYTNGIFPKLGCEVRYLGGCDIAVDWVRVGSEASEDVYWGKYDSLFKAYTQYEFNFLNTPDFASQKSILKRFYLRDEGNCSFWRTAKYYNSLIGNIGTFETGPELPDLYKHYVNPPEYWYSFYKIYSSTAAPYIRNGALNDASLLATAEYCGYKRGTHWESDSINSDFENLANHGTKHLFDPTVPFQTYFNNLDAFKSTQASFDEFVISGYLLENRSNLLFNGEKWWAQSFIYAKSPKMVTPAGFPTQLDTLVSFESRPKTAHELSLFCWQPLILGGKGVLVDGEVSSDARATPFDEKRIATNIGKNQYYYENCQLNDTTRLADLEGWDFIMHDSVGTDFFNPEYEWSGINEYIEWDVVPQALGVARNRMYAGRKSARIELKKFSDFVHNNESVIMPLKLQSWLGKGYRRYYLQHPDYTQDTIMSTFFDINNTGIKTRPIGRVKANGDPHYENEALDTAGMKIDSSFYDLTILADSNITSSTSTIYVGMLNRRTSPLIHINPAEDDNEQNEHLLFLSMDEINELCESGGNNPESGVYKTAEEWRTLYWQRQAGREIVLPFNYCDPDNPNDYVLLHVRELKADSAYNASWPWWRKERYANYIDTVIGQNSSLAVKFLPGEGKLFSIKILRPNPIQGNLAYSNQSKFIVFPDNADTNKVRYHLAYHKPDTTQAREGIMSVYYSRSFPMARNSDNSQIIWEPAICVSSNIFVPGPDSVYSSIPAYYPSLAVRKDGTLTKAYIVFATSTVDESTTCEMRACYPVADTCKDFLNPICESILDVGGASVNPPNPSTVIQNIVYGFRDNYGTPTVNCSRYGNFVAWSDSLCGIGIGYKSPSVNNFESKIFLSATGGIASHPSLNMYSIFDRYENDWALVWQEKEEPNSISSIYYTKIEMDDDSLRHFLPAQLNLRREIDTINNCIKFSGNESSIMPTVYRLPQVMGSSSEQYAHYDIIAFYTELKRDVVLRTFISYYNIYNPDKYFWSITYPKRRINSKSQSDVYSTMTHYFSNPVMSQITSYRKDEGLEAISQSAFEYLLNFQDYWSSELYGTGTKIYHLRNNANSYSDNNITKISSFSANIYPVAGGSNPHLAYSQVENTNADVWKNHRVYENGTISGYNKIVPNPIYFYPFDECPDCTKAQKMISFESLLSGGGFGNTTMSFPGISVPEPLPINLPYQEVSDSLGEYILPIQQDTIFTDWVLIDSTAELQYLVTLVDTTTVLFKLQKLSDSSFVDLPAPFIPDVVFSHQVFYLVNGNNDQYRLAMINTNTQLNYSENTYLEAPFVIDTIYAKRSYEVKQNVVNLNKHILADKIFNLSCMPNPAKEILNVAVYANQNTNVESVVLQLYNQQGMMVWENNSRINSTAAIPVDDCSNGMYLIRANITTKDGYYTETSKVLILK